MYKVLIIGCGRIAGHFSDSEIDRSEVRHAWAFKSHEGFEVSGCVDADRLRAENFAGRVGIPYWGDDVGNAMAELHPDVVVIATPDETHFEVVCQVFRQQSFCPRIVFLEKPACTDRSELDQLLDISHEIDYLRLLFGKPKKVTVKDISKTKSLFDIETNIIAIFEYSKKYPIVRMRLNMLSKNTKRYCKVYLDNSTLTIDHMNNSLLINKSTSTQSKYYKDNLNDSYMRELKNLSDAIKSNSNTDLEFEDCLTTQYMINAMHKSLQSKKSIAIR